MAFDLVNTVEWRLSAERFDDDLTDFDDVVRWGEQMALLGMEEAGTIRSLTARHPAAAHAEAERMRALREAIYVVAFDGIDASFLRDEYREAVLAGDLRQDERAWGWVLPTDLALLRHRVALEAHGLLTTTDASRFAQCQDAECGWVFLDTSPRRNRRWCVSADCGNRNRVRDFYDRARAAATP